MTELEQKKIKAFDLTMEIGKIQEEYRKKADELEQLLIEIKKCQE